MKVRNRFQPSRYHNQNNFRKITFPVADKDLEKQFFNYYFLDIPKEKVELFKRIFRDWAQSPRNEMHQRIFDVAGHHENNDIRDWAIEQIKNWSKAEYWEDYMRWWIRNPTPCLKDLIKFILEKKQDLILDKGLISAVFLLLDQDKDANKIDNDYVYLEKLIQEDPLILGPLAERVSSIRKRDFYYIIGSRTIILNYEKNKTDLKEVILLPNQLDGLWRSLRSGDWEKAWQILISASFICLIENLIWISKSDWKPKIKDELTIFETITEFIGDNGWKSCDNILFEIIEIENPVALHEKGLNIKIINNSIFFNPESFDFNGDYSSIQLGRFYTDINQTYHFTIKINDKDCILISLPIQLVEFLEPGGEIDDHHLYIEQVRLCISKIAICSLFMPLFQLTNLEYEWIKKKVNILCNKEDQTNRKILRIMYGLLKIQEYQGYKKFRIECLNLKKKPDTALNIHQSIISEGDKNKIAISLGIDFGNTKTAVTAINLSNFQTVHGTDLVEKQKHKLVELNEDGFNLPSLIYFETSSNWIIGKKADEYWASQQTFKEIKKNLRNSYRDVICVKGRHIFAPQAAEFFLTEILNLIDLEKFELKRIGIAYPLTAPVDYVNFLKNIIRKFLKNENQEIFVIDEASAAAIGWADKIDPFKQTFVLDIGGGTTDISILKFEDFNYNGIKTQIFSKDSNEVGGLQIDIAIYNNLVENNFDDSVNRTELLRKIRNIKEKISETQEDEDLIIKKSQKIKVTKHMIEEYLKHERYYEHLKLFIEKNLIDAINRGGNREIGNVLLVGGGCQWPKIREIVSKIISPDAKFFVKYDPFLVSKGIARGALGLNVTSTLLYDIGLFIIDRFQETFQVVLKKGLQYPSDMKIFSITSFTEDEKISLLFMRHWIKMTEEGVKSLQFDQNGQPSIIANQSYEYFEPLGNSIEIQIKSKVVGLNINQNGKLILYIFNSNDLKIHESFEISSVL